jgi:hypothetical protein
MRSTACLPRYTHRQRRAHQPGLANPDRCSRSFHRSRIDAARAASILLAARAAESPRITNVRAGDCSCVSGIPAIPGPLAIAPALPTCRPSMALWQLLLHCQHTGHPWPFGNCSCIANMPAIHGPQKKAPGGKPPGGVRFAVGDRNADLPCVQVRPVARLCLRTGMA